MTASADAWTGDTPAVWTTAIDRAEVGGDAGQLGDRVTVGHVDALGRHDVTDRGQRSRHVGERALVEVGEHHVAPSGEPMGDRAAHAAGTRDHDDTRGIASTGDLAHGSSC